MAVWFIGALAAWGSAALDIHKAPRALVNLARAQQTDRDIRVGSYQYFQPSLVFYCGREVQVLWNENEVQEFLRSPLQVFLFVPEKIWAQLQPRAPKTIRLLAKRPDMYRGCTVLAVTNAVEEKNATELQQARLQK